MIWEYSPRLLLYWLPSFLQSFVAWSAEAGRGGEEEEGEGGSGAEGNTKVSTKGEGFKNISTKHSNIGLVTEVSFLS